MPDVLGGLTELWVDLNLLLALQEHKHPATEEWASASLQGKHYNITISLNRTTLLLLDRKSEI
jgi:hypothetical protein